MLNTIILSLAAGIFIIAVHQTIQFGLAYSYWIFMFSIVLLLWHHYRKHKKDSNE